MDKSKPIRFGSVIRLKHIVSTKLLKALPETYRPPSKTTAPNQQVIVVVSGEDDACDWLIEAPHGATTPTDDPVNSGMEIRLRHLFTHAHLHSHDTSRGCVPTTAYKGMQEVTGYVQMDTNDNWIIEVIGGGPWLSDSLVKFRHIRSTNSPEGDLLFSHPDGTDGAYFYGRQGVVCAKDASDYSTWICNDVLSNQEYASALVANAVKGDHTASLDLSNLHLKQIPNEIGLLTNLTRLDLHNNQLELLPESLRALPLKELNLRGNPNLGLPESLLERPPEEFLRYFFEARDGRPLQELKLLVVGRGGSGKTTLIKRLAGEQADPHEPQSHSIAIRELPLDTKRGRVRMRVWDFGGQEILHATHQFFLTERSLYLLVLEPREGYAQRDAEYWLKLIETQGRGSPAIVVTNWSHGNPWQVDVVKLRRKFPFVIDFVSTDALIGDGIEHLRESISKVVSERMEAVWLPFPNRWRDIKNAVAGMHQNFISYDRYTAICSESGETEPAAQEDLAGILHALGLALYFGKDSRLHDTRVLNPKWVTGGVYAVIRSALVSKAHGQVAVSDMPQVLIEAEDQKVIKAVDYPISTHQFVLDLMRAFQLCYASDEKDGSPVKYLVPELLPEFEPALDEPWHQAQVRLRYLYDALPCGLLPRLIVRTHALSEDAPHWRHGVVLRHATAAALIREDTDRNELQVFVLGADDDTRTVLATMVRRELESLHKEARMHAPEELEITDGKEQFIGVKALREVEMPASTILRLPVQPDGTAIVNVTRELDKLAPAGARAIDRDPSIAPPPVRLFVSYAHDDEKRLKRLDSILDVLAQFHDLAPWSDKWLIAGDEWDSEIRRRLEDMDIFFFVASQISLARPYIKDVELPRARQRHAAGEIEVVTIKLEACACDEHPFLGNLQRLARKYKSVVETREPSPVWEQARKDLLPVIARARKRKSPRK